MPDIDALVAKFLRYAEIQEATETRNMGREATNSWSEGFRQAAAALTALSDEIAVLKEREGVMRDALTDAESKLRILADVAEDVRLEGAPMIRQCADNARAALTDKADGEGK